MKHLYTTLIAICLLFTAGAAYAQQGNNGNGREKVAVCHKGSVIWVSSASLPSHLAHGDQLAVMGPNREWRCPCPPDGKPPETFCPDGTPQTWYWDAFFCKWMPKDCPQCEPTSPRPDPMKCPDGSINYPYWDFQFCKWMFKDCPHCEPTMPPPDPRICSDGTTIMPYWDFQFCRWMFENCPDCQPTEPKPDPRQCPDGTVIDPFWDFQTCQWVFRPCPCDPANNPPPPCPIPGVQCCWKLTNDCRWILLDCQTQMPYPCGTVINGMPIDCNCLQSDGTIRFCP